MGEAWFIVGGSGFVSWGSHINLDLLPSRFMGKGEEEHWETIFWRRFLCHRLDIGLLSTFRPHVKIVLGWYQSLAGFGVIQRLWRRGGKRWSGMWRWQCLRRGGAPTTSSSAVCSSLVCRWIGPGFYPRAVCWALILSTPFRDSKGFHPI